MRATRRDQGRGAAQTRASRRTCAHTVGTRDRPRRDPELFGNLSAGEEGDGTISLTYFGTANRAFGEVALQKLLATSRRDNEARELTGMLFYVDGHFIETLEGSEIAEIPGFSDYSESNS